jgi:hypothetical protein
MASRPCSIEGKPSINHGWLPACWANSPTCVSSAGDNCRPTEPNRSGAVSEPCHGMRTLNTSTEQNEASEPFYAGAGVTRSRGINVDGQESTVCGPLQQLARVTRFPRKSEGRFCGYSGQCPLEGRPGNPKPSSRFADGQTPDGVNLLDRNLALRSSELPALRLGASKARNDPLLNACPLELRDSAKDMELEASRRSGRVDRPARRMQCPARAIRPAAESGDAGCVPVGPTAVIESPRTCPPRAPHTLAE